MQQVEIRQEMSAVRRRGLANAQVLAERMEKLSDWREHVRAHPWPIALAAGALAYWMIPTRPSPTGTGTATGTGTVASWLTPHESNQAAVAQKEAKLGGLAGIGAAAIGIVGSLIGNAVRSYVSEQVQTLITSRGNHDASQQRQAPKSRF